MSPADFGDPTASTDYSLCIIDHSSGQPVQQKTLTFFGGQICDGAPCWTQTGSGFKYKRYVPATLPSTLDKSKLVLKGGTRGGNLKLRSLRAGSAFIDYVLWGPITLRLYRSDAPVCWETTFPTPVLGGALRATYP